MIAAIIENSSATHRHYIIIPRLKRRSQPPPWLRGDKSCFKRGIAKGSKMKYHLKVVDG
jgi:hypothetical protein